MAVAGGALPYFSNARENPRTFQWRIWYARVESLRFSSYRARGASRARVHVPESSTSPVDYVARDANFDNVPGLCNYFKSKSDGPPPFRNEYRLVSPYRDGRGYVRRIVCPPPMISTISISIVPRLFGRPGRAFCDRDRSAREFGRPERSPTC